MPTDSPATDLNCPPKTDFMLREGTMSVKILQRIYSDDTSMGSGYRELTHNIHKLYVDEYAKMGSNFNIKDIVMQLVMVNENNLVKQ